MSLRNLERIAYVRKLGWAHFSRVVCVFLVSLLSISPIAWASPWFPMRQIERVTAATLANPSPVGQSQKSRKGGFLRKVRSEEEENDKQNKDMANMFASADDAPERAIPPVAETSQSDGFIVMVYDARDSLMELAKSCSTTPQALLSLNRLRYGDLRSGQVLRLPKPQEIGTTSILSKILAPEEQLRREIWRGVRGKRAIALTFDAGGEAIGVRELLAYLREAEVPATFFVTGIFVRRNPEIVREIAAQGHSIHNHSWSHPYFTKIEPPAICEELIKADDWVTSVTGRSTRPYWRPPFGDRNRRVLQLAAECGFQSVYWTLDSLDSYVERPTADQIATRVLSPLSAGAKGDDFLDGAIILMHVGESATVQALPTIVRELRIRGFRLVSLRELLEP